MQGSHTEASKNGYRCHPGPVSTNVSDVVHCAVSRLARRSRLRRSWGDPWATPGGRSSRMDGAETSGDSPPTARAWTAARVEIRDAARHLRWPWRMTHATCCSWWV